MGSRKELASKRKTMNEIGVLITEDGVEIPIILESIQEREITEWPYPVHLSENTE
jgi:hypothetical protein